MAYVHSWLVGSIPANVRTRSSGDRRVPCGIGSVRIECGRAHGRDERSDPSLYRPHDRAHTPHPHGKLFAPRLRQLTFAALRLLASARRAPSDRSRTRGPMGGDLVSFFHKGYCYGGLGSAYVSLFFLCGSETSRLCERGEGPERTKSARSALPSSSACGKGGDWRRTSWDPS